MKKIIDFDEHSNPQNEFNLEDKLKKYCLDTSCSNPLLNHKGRLSVNKQDKKKKEVDLELEIKNEKGEENQLENFKTIKISDNSLSFPENNRLTSIFLNEKTSNYEDYLAIKNYTSLQYYIYTSFSSYDSLEKLKFVQAKINENMRKTLEGDLNNNFIKNLQNCINLEGISKSKKKLLIMEMEGVLIHSSKKKIENFDSSFVILEKGVKKYNVK